MVCWQGRSGCFSERSDARIIQLQSYLVQYTSESVHRLHCLNIDSKYDSGAEAEPECSAAGVSKSC